MIAPLVPGVQGNESAATYLHNKAAHIIRYVDMASPELLMLYQTRVYAFCRKTSSSETVTPLPAEVRNTLFKVISR